MPSEAWESLPVEQKQQMHWLAARMTAHLMNAGLMKVMSAPTSRLVALEEAILKSSSVARKRTRRSSSPTVETVLSLVNVRATQKPVTVTASIQTASTMLDVARFTQALVVDEMPKQTRLDRLYNKWKYEEEFKHLSDNANFVPGAGKQLNPDAILIGEAPGKDEDKHLRPFCGRSGNMLDGMLWDAGLKRDGCFITNVVKWRPPNNRTPTMEEIEYSIPYLRKELMAVAPDGGLVILLGQVPLSVVDQDLRVGACHGNPFTRGNWTFVPMYHPAFILRQWRKRQSEYKADWAKIKELRAA